MNYDDGNSDSYGFFLCAMNDGQTFVFSWDHYQIEATIHR